MNRSEFEHVAQVFTEALYEHDPIAGGAYEQMRLQNQNGAIHNKEMGELMRTHFNVCPIPEDMYEIEE